jgi:hypothetical protein
VADNKEMFFFRTKVSVHVWLKQEVLPAGRDTSCHYINTGFGPTGPPLELVVGAFFPEAKKSKHESHESHLLKFVVIT